MALYFVVVQFGSPPESLFLSIRSVFRSQLRAAHPHHDFDVDGFCVAYPRDPLSPPQVLNLRQFDELSQHAIWLAQMQALQAYPARQSEYIGVHVTSDRQSESVGTLLATLRAKSLTQTGPVSVSYM